jgi:hypothetical protein
LWVISALLNTDPDPADRNQCGSMRITTQIYINFCILGIN